MAAKRIIFVLIVTVTGYIEDSSFLHMGFHVPFSSDVMYSSKSCCLSCGCSFQHKTLGRSEDISFRQDFAHALFRRST